MKIRHTLVAIIFCCVAGLGTSCSKSGGSNSGSGSGSGSGGGSGTGDGSTVNISIQAMTFSPGSVTVKVGTTVKWTNTDIYSPHTVTADNGSTFNSGDISSGGTFSFTPATAGTFPYHCNIHAGMYGTLIVTP